MKNALRVVAIVVVAAILFGIGYSMGSTNGIKITVEYSNAAAGTPTVDTTPSVQTPAASTPAASTPAADAPAADAPAADAPAADAPAADAPAADDKTDAPAADDKDSKIPTGTAAIVKAYNKAVNETKAFKGNVQVHKIGKMNITLEDCTVSFLTSQINSILQGLISDTDKTLTFTDGKAAEEDRWINDFLPPSGRESKLAEAGVLSANSKDNGDGTYTLTIKLIAEKSTFDGETGATVNPAHNESVVDPLNLATLELPAVKITKADMDYPGTTLEATVNADGLLNKLVVDLPMEGGGTGKLGASLEVVISGGANDTYDFTY